VITGRLWDLIEEAQGGTPTAAQALRPRSVSGKTLLFEQINVPKVMSAWEIRCHVAFVAEHALPNPRLDPVLRLLDRFADSWAALWAQFGDSEAGYPAYRGLADETRGQLRALGASEIMLRNELDLSLVIDQLVFAVALSAPPAPAVGTVTSTVAARRLAS
jgi:hypothetical protein